MLGHETLSLLDVGPRTGAGLALLRLLHHPLAFTRLKFEPVYGIDLDPEFERIAKTEFRDIHPLTGDIFDLSDKSYDIVTCSHTIEHIPDPQSFVEKLVRLARRAVFLACPYEEANRVEGHCVSIGQSFFDMLQFDDVEVYESQHWHNGLACLAYKKVAN
jgi:2-polyprenyl-3-methyl-5-hydroxy-6-metoxy-1,4-benzoquinol methylase